MSIKSDLTSKFSEIILFLPDKEIKKIIFTEWLNYLSDQLGFKLVNKILEEKQLKQLTKEEYDYELNFIQHVVGKLMVGNIFNFENSFKLLHEKNWEYFYVLVDIHSTILYPDYGGLAKKYYPMAKEVLQKLSNDKRIKLILYTCSYPDEIKEYLEFFKKDNINFEFVNKNPEVENTKGGYFQDKPYMNVLLDDKVGYIADFDWHLINYVLNKNFNF